MATKYTEDDLADLTEAERTALLEEDNEETTAAAATEGDGDAADADDTAQAKTDDASGADAAADAGADAGATSAEGDAPAVAAADEPAAKAQPEKVTVAPVAKVLIADAPENVDAQLAEIGSKKDALEDQFDSGDLTRAEYRKQMDALNKNERDIEQAQLKAQLATEMNEQAMLTAWRATAQGFAKDKGYSDNPRLFRAFDMEVQDVASSGKLTEWADILNAAHDNMVEAGLDPGKAGKTEAKAEPAKPAQQKVEHKPQPPNLASVPAAAHSDTSGSKYAALDRLRDSGDPDAYEDALMALPEKERDRYRASA